jgi:hypothetical protein
MGLLEGRRKRKAEEEAERQRAQEVALAADRQRVVEELEGLIEDSRTNFGIDAPGFEEKKGERTFAIMEGVALIEPRRQPGTVQGRSSGYSFRIAKGVNYRVGASKGTYVSGPDVPTPIDVGTAFVTNQRVVFRGSKATREWAWSKLISLDHDDDLPWTSLPVSNRQKTSGLLYDEPTSLLVRYRLQQGLAHFQGKVEALTAELEQQLRELQASG